MWKRGNYHPGFPDGTFQIRARQLTFSGSSVKFTSGENLLPGQGPVLTPTWRALSFAAGIVLVFAPIAVRAYGRKA